RCGRRRWPRRARPPLGRPGLPHESRGFESDHGGRDRPPWARSVHELRRSRWFPDREPPPLRRGGSSSRCASRAVAGVRDSLQTFDGDGKRAAHAIPVGAVLDGLEGEVDLFQEPFTTARHDERHVVVFTGRLHLGGVKLSRFHQPLPLGVYHLWGETALAGRLWNRHLDLLGPIDSGPANATTRRPASFHKPGSPNRVSFSAPSDLLLASLILMPSLDQQHSSGLPSLNDHLGGLQAGDNVVWVSDRERFHRVIETAFLTADTSVPRSLVLLDGQDIDVPEGVTLVDARPGERLADVVELEPRIVELGREPGARIVVRGLDTLTRRLGDERTLRFFTRTCPRLFDQGAIAYWRASRAGSGRVLDAVQRVTQCVFEFAGGRLHVRKSEGRPGLRGRIFDAELSDDSLELDPMPAAGRLAEGLRRIRNERGLTQT